MIFNHQSGGGGSVQATKKLTNVSGQTVQVNGQNLQSNQSIEIPVGAFVNANIFGEASLKTESEIIVPSRAGSIQARAPVTTYSAYFVMPNENVNLNI